MEAKFQALNTTLQAQLASVAAQKTLNDSLHVVITQQRQQILALIDALLKLAQGVQELETRLGFAKSSLPPMLRLLRPEDADSESGDQGPGA